MSGVDVSTIAAYAAGFAYAIAFGLWLAGSVVTAAWRRANRATLADRLRFLTPMVGTVEAVVYVASVLAGKPEVIAAWLVLKTVVVWKPMTTRRDGRNLYNVFLVGNGMSLACGVAGGLIALRVDEGKFPEAIMLAAGPIALAVILLWQATDSVGGVGARARQTAVALAPSWWDAAARWVRYLPD